MRSWCTVDANKPYGTTHQHNTYTEKEQTIFWQQWRTSAGYVSGIHRFRLETPHHSFHFPDITPSYEGSLLWCVTSLRSRRERSQTLVLSQRSLGRNSLLILASAYHSLRWRAGEAGTRGGTTCGGVLVNARHIVSKTVTTPGGAIGVFFAAPGRGAFSSPKIYERHSRGAAHGRRVVENMTL